MPPDIWIPLVKIRTSNHKLPVEIQSWGMFLKPREDRICIICNLGEVGDEFHYLARCTVFSEDRQKYIPSIIQDSSLQNFLKILKSDNIRILRGLAKFLNIVFGVFEWIFFSQKFVQKLFFCCPLFPISLISFSVISSKILKT